jgi:hypothetical protein
VHGRQPPARWRRPPGVPRSGLAQGSSVRAKKVARDLRRHVRRSPAPRPGSDLQSGNCKFFEHGGLRAPARHCRCPGDARRGRAGLFDTPAMRTYSSLNGMK